MDVFRRNRIGNTSLFVTPLCWGCAPLGHIPQFTGHEVNEKEAVSTVLAMFEDPINFLDTSSRVYGESEKRIGIAIKDHGFPADFVLATKADRDLNTNDFSAAQIRQSVEESINLLGLMPLDLVYLHDPEFHPLFKNDRRRAMEYLLGLDGPVAELERMKQEGLISHIGISGGPIDMLLEFVETGRFDAVITHSRYNLLWQCADPLFNKAYEMRMGVVNAAPYVSGILVTGLVPHAWALYKPATAEIRERVAGIEAVCRKYNVPLGAAALQFSMRDKRVSSTAVGVVTHEHIEKTIEFAQVSIPDELWDELAPFAIKEKDPFGWPL